MTTAVLVCPGRGTYNAAELGYLGKYFPHPALLARFDDERLEQGQEPVSALDGAARFTLSKHSRGDNASALIFAASYGDYLSLDRQRIDLVAVAGNSMGFYSALACAGALTPENGFKLANTMGALMQRALIGGQLVYTHVEEDWRPNPTRKAELLRLIDEINARHRLFLSIDLGGLLVVAGEEAGLKAFEAAVEPQQSRYPLRLGNHAAFHTPLQAPVAAEGRAALPVSLFSQPTLPLIDGRGAIWRAGSTDVEALWDYTLRAQVTTAYDFTHAIAVAAREFAPDLFIVAGPGATLGGAVAQSLVGARWRGMASKDDFRAIQAKTPILVAMGLNVQRPLVTTKGDAA